MEAILQMLDGFVEAAENPDAPTHELGDMAQFIIAAAQNADAEAMNAVAARLAPVVSLDSPHAPVTFVLAGAVIERGADPAILERAVLAPLPRVLEVAADFIETLETKHGEITDEVWTNTEVPRECMALDLIWRPAIAVLGASVAARAEYRPLRGLALRLAKLHPGGDWLQTMLGVLDDEPLVVIHPAEDRAFRCTMSGVATNFELHTLLQVELLGAASDGWLRGEKPPADVVRCARGEGPQMCETPAVGRWNLYTFDALTAEDTTPAVDDFESTDHWVWGEGTPADIPRSGAWRVLLLGPPSYERTYAAHRSFATLAPSLRVDEKLTAAEALALIRS